MGLVFFRYVLMLKVLQNDLIMIIENCFLWVFVSEQSNMNN